MRQLVLYFALLGLLSTLPACSIIDAQRDNEDSSQPQDVASADTSTPDLDTTSDTTPDAEEIPDIEDTADAEAIPDADALDDATDADTHNYDIPGDHQNLDSTNGTSCEEILECLEPCLDILCSDSCVIAGSERAQAKFEDYQNCALHYCKDTNIGQFESCMAFLCDHVALACENDGYL